jgi:hypothetical protein
MNANIAGLAEKAIVINLTIHQWGAVRSDERADSAVQREFGNDARAGGWRKNLLPQNPPEWQAVKAAANEIRKLHYWYTQPWSEGGRVLASAMYPEYSEKMRGAIRSYDEACDKFAAEFDRLKAEAIVLLGGLAREDDYPVARVVRRKCAVTIGTSPLSVGDWRAKLSRESIEELQRGYEQMIESALQTSTADLWSRLREAVEDLRTSVATYQKRIDEQQAGVPVRAVLKNGTFDTLAELVEVLPTMNIAGDPSLDGLVEAVKQSLCSVSIEDARVDAEGSESLRADLIKSADDIVSQMAAFMGAQ